MAGKSIPRGKAGSVVSRSIPRHRFDSIPIRDDLTVSLLASEKHLFQFLQHYLIVWTFPTVEGAWTHAWFCGLSMPVALVTVLMASS